MAPATAAAIIALIAAIVLTLGYIGGPGLLWAVTTFATLAWIGIPLEALAVFTILAVIFVVPAFRRELVTRWILAVVRKAKLLPSISETEREALLAGDSWIERELFSGAPRSSQADGRTVSGARRARAGVPRGAGKPSSARASPTGKPGSGRIFRPKPGGFSSATVFSA